MQQRPHLISRLLDLSSKFGLRDEVVHDAVLLVDRTASQAQRAYEIAEVRFREGISTQLELSETRVQLQQALANRARAARDLQVARKRLELLPYLPLSQSGSASAAPSASTTTGPSR